MERIRFGMILTPSETEALHRLAADDGLPSKAAWLRRTIRMEARRRGIVPTARRDDPDGSHTQAMTEDTSHG